jgi:hypothetical protein
MLTPVLLHEIAVEIGGSDQRGNGIYRIDDELVET